MKKFNIDRLTGCDEETSEELAGMYRHLKPYAIRTLTTKKVLKQIIRKAQKEGIIENIIIEEETWELALKKITEREEAYKDMI